MKQKIKVLINLGTLKSGGGQNVALNFLESFVRVCPEEIDAYFVVAKGSKIFSYVSQLKLKIFYVVPQKPLKRMLVEYFLVSPKAEKFGIDVIYSYFGTGLYSQKIPQVTGSADSNLYFPEIDFWSHYKGLSRLKRWLVDKYRIWGLKKSQAVIYENYAMFERANRLYSLPLTRFIKPSVNFDFDERRLVLPIEIGGSSKVGLFLCGWQLNKNILIIPELAYLLKKRGVDFNILLTANEDSSRECEEFKKLVRAYSVQDRVYLIGAVEKECLSSLYKQVDFVFLLSKLESFSNNIIEAWYFQKPLVIANEIWARSICGEAAIYVDRDNVEEISKVVESQVVDSDKVREVVQFGLKELESYPSIDQRTKEELGFVQEVANQY